MDGDVDRVVLIVEDDADIQFMLRLAVELLLGTKYTFEQTAAGALAQARAEKPSLVFVDIALPGNLELLDQLKSDPDTQNVPVIGINSRGMMTCAEAVRAGYDACFPAGEVEALMGKAKEYLS